MSIRAVEVDECVQNWDQKGVCSQAASLAQRVQALGEVNGPVVNFYGQRFEVTSFAPAEREALQLPAQCSIRALDIWRGVTCSYNPFLSGGRVSLITNLI